ncbi:hypothetical protein RDT67_20120 [Serratia fonticola]|uniref:Uncharacterized protein n=1 Tax=Serratia fonticola TaxID=47917 RepID=A0AAJ1YEK3_SERFO|nr:hypothetical protein [Serratia fonticola]MDQ9128728.1 hypothetical protein [Serratia fonticola]
MPIKLTPAAMVAAGVVILLALASIVGAGVWLASRHYQPTIDNLNGLLATCQSNNRQQAASIASQNAGVTALQVLGELRKATAAEVQQKAQKAAQGDYAQANEVLAERSDGDVCAAASSAFDDELRRERAK